VGGFVAVFHDDFAISSLGDNVFVVTVDSYTIIEDGVTCVDVLDGTLDVGIHRRRALFLCRWIRSRGCRRRICRWRTSGFILRFSHRRRLGGRRGRALGGGRRWRILARFLVIFPFAALVAANLDTGVLLRTGQIVVSTILGTLRTLALLTVAEAILLLLAIALALLVTIGEAEVFVVLFAALGAAALGTAIR